MYKAKRVEITGFTGQNKKFTLPFVLYTICINYANMHICKYFSLYLHCRKFLCDSIVLIGFFKGLIVRRIFL